MAAFLKLISLLILFISTLATGQVSKIDSLKIALEQENSDSGKIVLLLELGNVYESRRSDSLLYFHKQALELNNKTTRSINLTYDANFGIAKAYRIMGNYPEALKLLLEDLKIAEQNQDTSGIFYSKREIMWVYRGTGDLSGQKRILNELEILAGQVYKSNPARGTVFYRIVYNSKAGIFKDAKAYDSARYYYSTLYRDAIQNPGSHMHSLAAGGLSDVYFETSRFDSALYYARVSSKLAFDAGRFDIYRGTYLRFAKIFLAMGFVDSSFQYAYQGLREYQLQSDTSGNLSKILLLISQLHAKKKNYDSAYYYLSAYYKLNDEALRQQRVNDVQDLSMREILNQKDLEQKIKAERGRYESRLKIYGLTGGLALLLLLAIFLYRNNYLKHNANKILQQKNEQIENTLAELKSTQDQLIHSEKMASLGELTAGIAHEIQNPLNFVNNFSDVNQDLVDELKDELQKGDIGESIKIADALKDNEAKINVHGKRAEAIVKGMLQHSRTSSEQKELSDINKLADEYLRLSYHGYRAKNKSFNAELETNYDAFIGKVKVLPQDLGRVMLNLYNNAFYAVAERKAKEGEGYHPLVAITTKKMGDKVEIVISDNGPGVPDEIRAKIFQPFYTTKPSGQGTGLGLSLSYDIIKKGHGGEMLIEQTPGGGATFRIILPAIGGID